MISTSDLLKLSDTGVQTIEVLYQGFRVVITITLTGADDLTVLLMGLYETGVTAGSITDMTYEEWLESIRGDQGLPGTDGREVTIQVSNGFIQWKYSDDSSWNNLVELTTLVGPAGADGVDGIDGKQVIFQVSEGFIQWQYVGDLTWNNLIDLATITGADGTNGTDGVDGREVLFQVADGFIQWQYNGDTTWNNLVELTTLVGPAGADGVDGVDGKQVTFQVSEGFIQWQYVGDLTWNNLIDLQTITGADGTNGTDGSDGIDGREVLFQVSDGYIQWQYTGDSSWTNLVSLATLTGADGTNGTDGIDGREVLFQVSDGYIQWQYTGDTSWTNLVSLSTLTGADGTDGSDGREVLFQVSDGYIQWQYTGDTTWTNLVSLSTLTGADGTNGTDGSDGIDGREVLFQVSDGYIQWQYTGDTTWTNLVSLSTLTGADGLNGTDGKSAYEIYLENYPEYEGDEQQWLNDLINGNLGIVKTFTVTFNSNGGTSVAPQDIEDNDKVEKPVDPTKEGYTFLGWYINGDEKWVFGGYDVTQNITLTAHWSINSYTVTYVQNNNQEDLSLSVHPFTELIQPTKAGYTFAGWFTTINFEENTSVDIMPADNVTLYAKWFIVNYQIDYVLDGGINSISNSNTYTITTNTITLNDPIKEGYTFLGWYTEDTFINKVTEITLGTTEDMTLYAKWSINQYTITL